MKKIFIALFASIIAFTATAGNENVKEGKNWSVRLSVGYNIGGTAPMPMPVEIRSIEGFNPGLNLSFEESVQFLFGKGHWGLRFGARVETKGMTTNAQTKNYYMEVVNGDGVVAGNWTGKVETTVKNIYLTTPLLAVYQINDRWNVSAGAYASFLLNGKFTGYAYEGYLREGNPTGEKIELDKAAYDFSDDLRKFNWGLQAGAECQICNHLAIFADIKWGLNGIFPSDYNCVTFALYPIYGTLGLTCNF